jgi:hypothetical protein
VISKLQIAGIRCIGCGCTAAAACPGGCSWVVVNEESGYGLCSVCAAAPLEYLIVKGLFPPPASAADAPRFHA